MIITTVPRLELNGPPFAAQLAAGWLSAGPEKLDLISGLIRFGG